MFPERVKILAGALVPAALLCPKANGSPVPGSDTSFVAASSGYYDIIRQSSSNRDLKAGASVFRLEGLICSEDDEWNFCAERFSGRISNALGDQQPSFSLSQERSSFSGMYTRRLGLFAGSLGVNVSGNGRDVVTSTSAAMAVRTGSPVLKGLVLGFSEVNLPGNFAASYADAALSFPYAIHGIVSRARADFSAGDFDGSVEGSTLLNRPSVLEGDYSYVDSSHFSDFGVNLRYSGPGWSIEGLFTKTSFGNAPDFYFDGTTYGHSNVSGGFLRRYAFTLRARGMGPSLTGGNVSLGAKIVGNVQSWPFADLVGSLIDNRLNYRVSGDVSVWYLGVSCSSSWGGLRFCPEIYYYDVRPSLSIQSWQPEFLVFGFKDLSDNSLDLRRAGLGLFQMSLEIPLPIATFMLSGGQVFPIFTEKLPAAPALSSGPANAPSAPATKTSGGRWIHVTLMRSFD